MLFLWKPLKNYDLFLAYKANIVIFLFLRMNRTCWQQNLYWIWLSLFVLPVVSWEKEASMGNLDFNSGQTNLWKIYYHII